MDKIDLSYLENITGGDNEVMTEMIDLILNETPKHIANLKQSLENKNWTELGAESHKLKPMFLYVGLTELNEITQRLEQYSKQRVNLESVPSLIKKLEEEFEEVISELKEKKRNLS